MKSPKPLGIDPKGKFKKENDERISHPEAFSAFTEIFNYVFQELACIESKTRPQDDKYIREGFNRCILHALDHIYDKHNDKITQDIRDIASCVSSLTKEIENISKGQSTPQETGMKLENIRNRLSNFI